ncbi:anhydro-N-acetylmuramic acid kinase [Terrimonas sp.]|uniref:anhydro-N-acetylmuramic acid kinase n=1 Tax=Terrimonas sp. TaxID=1914338 RepID=UPI000D50B12D|nr:anhydro-N-acetylmuramic acid kinase [Terrimonas sp.]PVD49583.1 anhydro-N-acetylmuramic acid kinase [Terrimonas sp.]
MIYRAIGLMSGSSLDGLDIAFVHLHENAGKWSFDIVHADCYAYTREWKNKLQSSIELNALDYLLLDAAYGHYTGALVNEFISKYQLHYKVQLIASHGHTTFHVPSKKMTAQLGNGAAIAAETGIPVVSNLRALDVAFGGQGAPIVPVGDKLLFAEYNYCLNIGGIANISSMRHSEYISFDICPANRVLNMLAEKVGKDYDSNGDIASSGTVKTDLLQKLNALGYYAQAYPKSLANSFGTDIVYPLLESSGYTTEDLLATYVEHIVVQIKDAVEKISDGGSAEKKLLATGGGALNAFLMERLQSSLSAVNITVTVPEQNVVLYKEALVMALIGVLRWREENNVMASVTGAARNSVNGAVWMGAEA